MEHTKHSLKIYKRQNKILKPKQVVFAEHHEGKYQGLVSSGSSKKRVYVCVINYQEGTITCHTNNNRACSGLGYGGCSHLKKFQSALMKQGVDYDTIHLGSADRNARYPEVFSRYLENLEYLELPETEAPIMEMEWFLMENR